MELLVLDTSVILKWFTQENYSDAALKIREEFYKGAFGVVEPDLMIYEFANALRYNKSYSAYDVKKAIDSLIELQIDIVMPTVEMLKEAYDIARQHDVTIYDAVFISLAKLIGGSLITADEKLYNKVSKLKFVKFITHFSKA